MFKTEKRKHEHVKISLEEDVSSEHNYWDDVKLIHNALPEIDKGEINLSVDLFKKKIFAPIILSSMTGGYSKGKKINENLAAAAEKYQVGMGVGSQRAAIENPDLEDTYSVVKDYDIPLKFANIGASQIVLWGHEKTVEYSNKMIDMIDADVLIICLNFLQEAVMSEGESNARGVLSAVEMISKDLGVPVIVKESGAGISYDVASKLLKTNIAGIDVGGLGGTSFAAIEHFRAKMKNDRSHERGGKTFWNWGIPTPTSVLMVNDAAEGKLSIIATGGIRNGLDVAKSLVIGANAAGIARAMLKPAFEGKEETDYELEMIIKELRASMYLLGIDNVGAMKNVDWTIVGDDLWI